MVSYTFEIDNPQQQYLKITATFPVDQDHMTIKIPTWRPGRYEIGNFAKNVRGFKVFSDSGKRLCAVKSDSSTWIVETPDTKWIKLEYSYYSAELNAGSTYLSPEQLYVNPVNCCIYADHLAGVEHKVSLKIPSEWKYAGALSCVDYSIKASSFDELADSPFICSAGLQHDSYAVGGVEFNLWFQGECKPDWDRLKKDFTLFSEKQIEKFTEFPEKEYHFLFQILPVKAYHGVEHCRSTVIALGPSYEVFQSLYKELLGVSSHELYHTWNVKNIRPIEMLPYDFSKQNYSRLGYICEGITTYMGDLFLLKSGVFNLKQYLVEFNAQLQKHFDNQGRFNLSVGDSSFDTWLDGYVPGAPGRKVSIYTEGCLLAFVTDVRILKATKNKYGLDEVMKRLYFDYALKNKGVSESDYKSELEKISGESWDDFFKDHINGTSPYEGIVSDALEYLGLEIKHFPSKSYAAARVGFKFIPSGTNAVVSAIYPGGPADLGGLMLNDEIIAINGYQVQADPDKWLNYFDDDEKKISLIRDGRLLDLVLPEVQRNFYMEYSVVPMEDPNGPQQKGLDAWMK